MAKSKKSKILASMLAVSTMAVFYAAPVMAGDANIDATQGQGITINVAVDGDPDAGGNGLYTQGPAGLIDYRVHGQLTITSANLVTALEGQTFNDLTINNLDTTNLTVNGETVDLSQLADVDLSNVKGITRSAGATTPGTGTTTIEGVLSVDGTTHEIYNAGNTFNVDDSGNVDAASFHATTGDVSTTRYSLNTVGADLDTVEQRTQKITYVQSVDTTNISGKVIASGVTLNNGNISTNGTLVAKEVANASGDTLSGVAGDVDDLTLSVASVSELTQNIDADRTTAGITTFKGDVNVDGNVKAATADFGQMTLNGQRVLAANHVLTVGDETLNFRKANQTIENTAGIERESGVDFAGRPLDTTTIEGKTTIDSLGRLNTDTVIATTGQFGDVIVTGNSLTNVGFINGAEVSGSNGALTISGVELNNGLVDGVDVSELSSAATDISGLVKKTAGIDKVGAVTTVEGVSFAQGRMDADYVLTDGLKVNGVSDLDGVRIHNGSIIANNSSSIGGVSLGGGLVDGVDVSELNSTVEGTTVDITALEQKTAGISKTGPVTTVEGVAFAQGHMDADAVVTDELTVNGLSNLDGVRVQNGSIYAENDSYIGGVQLADGLVDGVNMENLKGIERIDYGNGVNVTKIEGVTEFDNTGMGVYTDTGASVIGGGRATFNDGESTTSIIGGAITAETLNGKVIDDLVEGSDIADDLANVSGITRTDENYDGKLDTTTIEGSTSFDANGMNVGNGAVAANADGSFSAGNGQFDVASDGTLTISNANDPLGDKTQIGAGYINLGDTSINGFGIETPYIEATTGEIGGVTIDGGLVDGVDVSEIGEAVGENGKLGGITREDRLTNITGLDTTVIEDSFSVNKENINMFGDNGLDFTYGTMPNGEGGVNVAGNLNFMSGADVTFKYSDSKSYSLNDLVDGISDLNDRVEDLEHKTQNINGDATHGGNGQTGQGGEVIDNGANTGFDGDVTVGGDLNVNGGITADHGNIGGVDISGGAITTGDTTINGDGVTVGGSEGVSIKDNGMTVGGEGGTVISDSDVVINEGTDSEVSLKDTADRVSNVEQGVAELNNRVGELEDRIDKVGAMAAAIANLRTMGYDPAAPTEVAVGIGQYRDETGAALGLFHYPNRDFMLSLSVSTSGDEVMGGIGATWKFGRKSPEKVAEIKKAQAEADARRAEEAKLAKAEEMKQAAKEAKIKAQQERHAKLAAERAAQAEAAK